MIILALLWQLSVTRVYADDTCTFMTTANDIPPNIVILLDNGASMEEIVWHSGNLTQTAYDNSLNYTPVLVPESQSDIVQTSTGNGFYRDKGYSVKVSGGKYYLVEIPDDLVVANHLYSRLADGDGKNPIWTINGRTITLPAVPSSSSVEGVIDKAANFRFSKNYLNWIFFGPYSGDGSDLPNKTRFYYAKKALMTIAKMAANQASFSIYNFTANANGATNVQPLGLVVNTPLAANPEYNTLNSSYVNNINNMGTVTYSPLAEGLASIGGYYGSPSSGVVGYYCQKSFALIVSPGLSSEDKSPAAGSSPGSFSDYDNDNSGIIDGITEGYLKENNDVYKISLNQNGTSYLDDVACYLYKNDIVDYQPGFQNIRTYTVGFMGDKVGNLFLINTSNNGNGIFNIYDTTHKDYGKYHYVAQSPEELAASLLDAVNDIIAQTNSFTAPVVPVTRTTSGNRIYMAFFKPDKDNFWEGNVTKFGLSTSLSIIDKNENPATYPNGAIIDGAVPYWQTKDWANPDKTVYIHYNNRKIYTYLGTSADLTDSTNAFNSSNVTSTHMGISNLPTKDIIDYIRGADIFDQDKDNVFNENRSVITGDVLHSEPLVIHYRNYDGSAKSYVFFGSNDGMLHAVKDVNMDSNGNEIQSVDDGKEEWAFIPPDLLPKLKYIIEGTSHQYFVDSSPKAYFKDDNNDGIIDRDRGEKIILVCGERGGGSGYFALDITIPDSPRFSWRIDNVINPNIPVPNTIISDLGQSWSEPQFGLVKNDSNDITGIPVMFIGGGYSSNNSYGKSILMIKVLTGEVLRTFKNDSSITTMNYSIPSNVLAVDSNDNGFIDKIYVGDLGGQLWRLGKFTDFTFPDCDETYNNWVAQNIFIADSLHTRLFYYPPSITLERGYDLLFIGTGDRENSCATTTYDKFYCIRDKHTPTTYYESDLVDITNPLSIKPSLDNLSSDVNNDGRLDQGWFIQLAAGEKVLAENSVFYKTVYFTTFTPDTDPCVPGGDGRVYALHYKTSGSVIDFDKDGTKDRSVLIGGGIPSKTVMVISDTLVPTKMLISVGSTNPNDLSYSFAAGVISIDPLAPDANFLYRWWRDLTNF